MFVSSSLHHMNAFHSSSLFCMSETLSLSVGSLWRLISPTTRNWPLPFGKACSTTASCHSWLSGHTNFSALTTSLGTRPPLLLPLVQQPRNQSSGQCTECLPTLVWYSDTTLDKYDLDPCSVCVVQHLLYSALTWTCTVPYIYLQTITHTTFSNNQEATHISIDKNKVVLCTHTHWEIKMIITVGITAY